MDFDEAKRWYDGYELPDPKGDAPLRIYAPFSVMRSMESGCFASYWTNTATYDSLLAYIERDFDGLQDKVADLVAGDRLAINPRKFDNDLREVNDSDDVFTLLAHLGYVAYDEESDTVRIPNEEVRREFVVALDRGSHPEIRRLVEAADKTLHATLCEDAQTVAVAVQTAHDLRVGPDWYNDVEQGTCFSFQNGTGVFFVPHHLFPVYCSLPAFSRRLDSNGRAYLRNNHNVSKDTRWHCASIRIALHRCFGKHARAL